MKILNIFRRKEFLNSSIMSFTNFFVGGMNFVFHILMQRMLGPEKYGVVYPLIILSLFITLIPNTFQFFMTRDLSILIHKNEENEALYYIKNALKWQFILSILLLLSYLILLPWLKVFLKIEKTEDFIYLIVMTLFPFFYCVFIAYLQARENFIYLSIIQIIPSIIKLLTGFLVVYLTKNYLGVIAAFIAGSVFTIILIMVEFLYKKDKIKVKKNNFETKKFFSSFIHSFPAISGFTILSNIDSIIVRSKLPELSGIYSSVSVIGKASFYIALSISTVFLPVLSKSEDLKKSNRLALIFLTMFLLAFLGLIFISSPIISTLILKGQYAGFEKLLPFYSLAFIPYAYITYLVNYYVISKKKIYDISILIAIIIQIAGIFLFCKDLIMVASVVGISGLFVLVVLILENFIEKKFH
ncbi:MAG: oligosaccharide flippase family protein [Brevinematales bacterium]|nr:oligosaccharide flippase family protein [Brevinematales bacterium]